jgi:hypothetical protein
VALTFTSNEGRQGDVVLVKRLRIIVALGAVTVLGLVIAPSASAGPESGLAAICRAEGGTWNGGPLRCTDAEWATDHYTSFKGADRICRSALHGLLRSNPGERYWFCDVP